MKTLLGVAAVGLAGAQGLAQFEARNVDLLSNVTLAQFGPQHTSGAMVWGYVSPSGREYALMGLSNAMAVVEVTNPKSPVIVGQIPHANTLWCDVRTFGTHAYVVNDSVGTGLKVVDLSQVDSGSVSLLRTITANNLRTAHTCTVNPASATLYLVGSNVTGSNGGLVAYSLADPSNPVRVGMWTTEYVHEATVITYASGPYAGREIAFLCNGSRGLKIVDVTNKSAMTTIGSISYPGTYYTHQCWPDEDRRLLYINDEFDENNGYALTTRTIVVNIENLSAPVFAGQFFSATNDRAIDHNLYIQGRILFESNYGAGLRIFDLRRPLAPFEVGFIDTHPEEHGGPGYHGNWGNYPFLPSGNILLSDMQRGLIVVDARAARHCLDIDYAIDGEIDFSDVEGFLVAYGQGVLVPAGAAPGADLNMDGEVDFTDIQVFIAKFNLGCR